MTFVIWRLVVTEPQPSSLIRLGNSKRAPPPATADRPICTTRPKASKKSWALPVADLAAPDCVLFMWMVDWCPQDALDLIDAWGFEHKTTAFTWAKENQSGEGWFMGQGYWTRANPEDCWLATRGHPKRLHADVRQLITARVAEHSRKPDEIYERIERLVDGPYLELYARRERPGWMTWGNELPFLLADDAVPQKLIAPRRVAAAPVVDEVIDLPNVLRRGAGNIAPWMNNGETVRTL